jgi:hypothetical protein
LKQKIKHFTIDERKPPQDNSPGLKPRPSCQGVPSRQPFALVWAMKIVAPSWVMPSGLLPGPAIVDRPWRSNGYAVFLFEQNPTMASAKP